MSGIPRHDLQHYLRPNTFQNQGRQQDPNVLRVDWVCCQEKCKQRINNNVHKEFSCTVCRHKVADCNECLENRLYDHNAIPELPSPTFSSSNTGFGRPAATIAAQEAAKSAGKWDAEEAMRRKKRATGVERRDSDEKWKKRNRRVKCVIL